MKQKKMKKIINRYLTKIKDFLDSKCDDCGGSLESYYRIDDFRCTVCGKKFY